MRFFDVFSRNFWTGRDTEQIVDSFDEAKQNIEEVIKPALSLSQETIDELFNTYGIAAFQVYSSLIYSQLSQRKSERLKIYRQMLAYPDISDAVDEISDAFLNNDINNRFINLVIKNNVISETRKKILISEFDKFISYFNFETNIYSYVRTFMGCGELFFENIIDKDCPEKGIIGIKEMEPDGFEFLKIPNSFENIGFIYYPRFGELNNNNTGASFGTVPLPSQFLATAANAALTPNEAIAVPMAQVTYINSNNYDVTKSIVYPVLEKIRKLYNQVTMLEDAAITYRIARSPARLVFNVNSGGMPRHRAEQEVLKLMRRFQTRKAPQSNSNDNTISNVYENNNALESYFFLKNGTDGGTDVTTLDSSVGFDQMEDIKYFKKALYNALKIPYNRVTESDVEGDVNRRTDTIGYAEYRFAKFVMRLQNNFAAGLLKAFKIHLSLTGLWNKYDLNPLDLKVNWAPPTEFELYNRLKLQQSLYDVYSSYANKDEFSKIYLMKKILNWTNEEIDENATKKIIEIINNKQVEYMGEKIVESGMMKPIEGIENVNREAMLRQIRAMFINQSPSSLERDFVLAKNDTYAIIPKLPGGTETEEEPDEAESGDSDESDTDMSGSGGGSVGGGMDMGDGEEPEDGEEEPGEGEEEMPEGGEEPELGEEPIEEPEDGEELPE